MRMSRRLSTASIALTTTLIVAAAPPPQEQRQSGPPPYDAAAEVTVSGTILSLETFTPPNLKEPQAILMATIGGSRVGVFLGPAAWLKQQNVPLAAGATVQVTGLEGYRFNGHAAMTPRVVRVGTRTLALRDATGQPLWEPTGTGRRSPGN